MSLDILERELAVAHYVAAKRPNASTQALIAAYGGSGDAGKAISAAMATIGGKHAPVPDIVRTLQGGQHHIAALVEDGEKVPGWGNSFFKSDDPSLEIVFELIKNISPHIHGTIQAGTGILRAALDNDVAPNIGCATAAYAILKRVHPDITPFLFARFRLAAWQDILTEFEKTGEFNFN